MIFFIFVIVILHHFCSCVVIGWSCVYQLIVFFTSSGKPMGAVSVFTCGGLLTPTCRYIYCDVDVVSFKFCLRMSFCRTHFYLYLFYHQICVRFHLTSFAFFIKISYISFIFTRRDKNTTFLRTFLFSYPFLNVFFGVIITI